MPGAPRVTERDRLRQWRAGQVAAGVRQAQLARAEGPRPAQAVAEATAALGVLARLGLWPGPRDPHAEHEVKLLRRRWAAIQRRARRGRPR